MADKGIIFSAPMVRALLDGRKTQTRRLIAPTDKPPRTGDIIVSWPADAVARKGLTFQPPYHVGDRLYVREAWGTWGIFDDLAPSELTGKEGIAYVADYADPRGEIAGKLRPSTHMPRWASRLWLLVTDVRVQRVQDISDEDIWCECDIDQWAADYLDAKYGKGEGSKFRNIRLAFAELWKSLHAKPGERWEDNPWIVAVTFEVNRGNIDSGGARV